MPPSWQTQLCNKHRDDADRKNIFKPKSFIVITAVSSWKHLLKMNGSIWREPSWVGIYKDSPWGIIWHFKFWHVLIVFVIYGHLYSWWLLQNHYTHFFSPKELIFPPSIPSMLPCLLFLSSLIPSFPLIHFSFPYFFFSSLPFFYTLLLPSLSLFSFPYSPPSYFISTI